MRILSFDYAWRLMDAEAGRSEDQKFKVEILNGRAEITQVLESERSLKNQFLTLSAIPDFTDFSAYMSRIGRENPDSEPTVWTVDDYSSYRVLDTSQASVTFPKHELRDNWNPTFVYRVWQKPSMRLWDSAEARDLDRAIRTYFVNGYLPIWDDCKSALAVWKKGNRFEGIHCLRINP